MIPCAELDGSLLAQLEIDGHDHLDGDGLFVQIGRFILPFPPPSTPPKVSGASGASLMSAISLGVTVGAMSFPPAMNKRFGATVLTTAASAGGGGGGGGATNMVVANAFKLMVSV